MLGVFTISLKNNIWISLNYDDKQAPMIQTNHFGFDLFKYAFNSVNSLKRGTADFENKINFQ